jgi:hypothetical protein
VLCKVMEVSRSGFYEYFHSFNKRSDDSPEDAALKARIGAIFKEHREANADTFMNSFNKFSNYAMLKLDLMNKEIIVSHSYY